MSYSRSSYKSSSYRYSSDLTGDEGFSTSRLSSSTASALRSSARASLIDTDEPYTSSAAKRSSRPSIDENYSLTSARRTSRGLAASDYDDALSSSRRLSGRLTSRTSQDEIDTGYSSTSHRRLLSRMSDNDENIGDDFGVSLPRRSIRGLDDETTSYTRQASFASSAAESKYSSTQKKTRLSSIDSSDERSFLRSSKYSFDKDIDIESKAILSSLSTSEKQQTSEKGGIYVAILDYSPPRSATDEISMKEGQECVVLADDKPHRWKVRTKAFKDIVDVQEGFVPSCYLEKRAEQSKPAKALKRFSSVAAAEDEDENEAKIFEAKKKRKTIVKELVDTEEDFNRDMQFIANTYLKHMDSNIMPKELRDLKIPLFGCFKEIADFHKDVLMKGIQYYATEEPNKIGSAFLRLERDFDRHVTYCRDLNESLNLLQSGDLKDYFDSYSLKIKDDKRLSDHLKLPAQRINDYQLLLKELIKFTARLGEETSDLEKAQELMAAIPQRATDLQYLHSIKGYKGNLLNSGRILKHDWFEVIDSSETKNERYAFLFSGKLLLTDVKTLTGDKKAYIIQNIIKLEDVEFEDADEKTMSVKQKQNVVQGFPMRLIAKTSEQKDEWSTKLHGCRKLTREELAQDEPEFELECENVVSSESESQMNMDNNNNQKASVDSDKKPDEPEAKRKRLDESEDSDDKTKSYSRQTTLESEISSNQRDEKTATLTAESTTQPTESLRTGSISSSDAADSSSKPLLKQPLKTANANLGETAKFECEIAGDNLTEINWLKNNQVIENSSKYKLDKSENKYSLTLNNVSNDDANLYTIIARNNAGSVSSSATLTIKPDTSKGDSRPSTPGGTLLPHPPVFKVKLKDTELLEGTTVRFELVVRGVPHPTISFYKNGRVLEESDHVKLLYQSKEVFELFIDHVNSSDAGEYKCVARNNQGEDETSCKITITKDKILFKGIEELEADVEMSLGNETAANGGTDSRSRTPLFKWFKDGQEFEASERFQCQFDNQEDTIALVFQHVTPDDAGLYTCVASTSSGKMSCSAELTVQGEIHKLLRDPEAPALKAKLNDIEAVENGSAMFEAKVTGYPKPKITWYKNGTEIEADDRHKFLFEDEESFTLIVKKVCMTDVGQYSIKAVNDLGEVKCDCKLTVTCSPKFKKNLVNQVVKTDEKLCLEVAVEAQPVPECQWFKDGQPLKTDERIKLFAKPEDELFSLTIDKVQPEDAGNYSCVVTNSHGQQVAYSVVSVNAPPKFLSGMTDKDGNIGEAVKFNVKLSGNPKPKVKFLKDDQEVKLDMKRIKLGEEAENSFTLTINELCDSDKGVYTCVAENEFGSSSSSGKLCIKCKPCFKESLTDKEVSIAEDVTLIVKIDGYPKPEVHWRLNGNEIKEKEKLIESVDGSTHVYKLLIGKVDEQKVGEYKCEAINASGKCESSGKLTLNKADEDEKQKADDDSGKKKETEPKFDQKLNDNQVAEGEKVDLMVKFSGEPKPDIVWKKDGKEIGNDDHVKIENGPDYSRLIIDKSTPDDTGKYSCEASNDNGTTSSDGNLKVKPKSIDTYRPEIKSGLNDVNASEGDKDLILKVVVNGEPKPKIKWFHNGNEIAADGNHQIKETANADDNKLIENVLTIPNVKREDAGEYKVKAINSEGAVESVGNLNVNCSPRFERSLSDANKNEGENLSLSVKISGYPKPVVQWMKDGEVIKSDGDDSGHIKIIEKDNDHYELNINNLSGNDNGKYSCAAKNDYGSKSCDGNLVVNATDNKSEVNDQSDRDQNKQKPSFNKPLGDCECNEGNANFELSVIVDGHPKPHVRWFKNGLPIETDDNYRIKEQDNEYKLILSNVCPLLAGKYSVEASNSEGEIKSSGELSVNYTPVFKQKLHDVSANPADEVRLHAQVIGYPKPEIRWIKNGDVIMADDKRYKMIENEDNFYSLVLDSVQMEDAGEYMCDARNAAGRAHSQCKVGISGAPVFKRNLSDLELSDGDLDTKLVVELESQAVKPIIKWYVDDIQITELDKRYEIVADDNKLVYSLIIKNANEGTVGLYKCVARNGFQENETSGNVTIIKRPEFVEGFEDIEIREHESISMTAVVLGSPKPTLKWYKDDVEIIETDQIKITQESEQVYMLEFLDMNSEMTGVYKCVARNSAGEAVTQGKIDVLSKPRFLKNLEDTTAFVGEATKLEVWVSGNPKPKLSWYKNAEKVMTKLDSENADNRFRLNFQAVRMDHEADYYCVAANKIGESKSKEAHLYVKQGGSEGQPPRFVKTLSDKNVEISDEVLLEVKVQGEPTPAIKWFLNDQEIYSHNESYEFASNIETGEYSLRIKNMLKALAGKYRAEATNLGGKVETSGIVKLTSAPMFTQRLNDIVANEGDEMVDFTVKIDGFPAPSVKWFFNGNEILDGDKRFEIFTDKDDQSYTLRVPKVHSLLVGDYSVVAENSEGRSESRGKLQIQTEPMFLQKLKNTYANPAEEVRLKVKYKGFPKPTIKWFRNDKEINTDRKHCRLIEEEEFSCTLIINNVSLDDVGNYRCEAVNDNGKASTEAKLYVSAKPIIKREMTNMNLMNGEAKLRRPELCDYRLKMYRDPANARSESKYQTGDDTYVLQYRDVDFPLRVREYLRVGCQRSPSLMNQMRQGHWGDANIGYGFSPQVSIRERRKFIDVMDEEIDDEKLGRDTRSTPMRLVREVGTPGYAYGQIHHLKQEAAANKGIVNLQLRPPFFREKIKDVSIKEGEEAVFVCFAVGDPAPSYTWFRNDGILLDGSRIKITKLKDGRCELRINPAHAYDVGCYKCVARNDCTAIFCRARLKIGSLPGSPDPPVIKQCTDTQVYLCWSTPRNNGNSPILAYSLEMRKTTDEEDNWIPVVDHITHEFFIVHDLIPNSTYNFRLKAQNKFGWSEPSIQSRPAKTELNPDAPKIVLPRCQIFRQKKTESGSDPGQLSSTLGEQINYEREADPLVLNLGEHGELYNFVAEITRGRFSLIAKAFVKELSSTMNCKVCLNENVPEAQMDNEFTILKSLAHERIVQLNYASKGTFLYVLAMEKLSGIDVLTYLSSQHDYTEETVSIIVLQVLDALEYLHFRGICLLELQPDNVVMINQRTPDIKLVDFANARFVPPTGGHVMVKGVTEYLAPEIIKNEEVSTATDVWCLGVLTYILLSGASPFHGETEADTIENVTFVRYHFDHLQVTQEAIRFLMLIFKKTPEKRPTLEECDDHKWLMPNEFMMKKRENTVFSSEKLLKFAERYHSEKQSSTPQKLFALSGMALTSD